MLQFVDFFLWWISLQLKIVDIALKPSVTHFSKPSVLIFQIFSYNIFHNVWFQLIFDNDAYIVVQTYYLVLMIKCEAIPPHVDTEIHLSLKRQSTLCEIHLVVPQYMSFFIFCFLGFPFPMFPSFPLHVWSGAEM